MRSALRSPDSSHKIKNNLISIIDLLDATSRALYNIMMYTATRDDFHVLFLRYTKATAVQMSTTSDFCTRARARLSYTTLRIITYKTYFLIIYSVTITAAGIIILATAQRRVCIISYVHYVYIV